MRKVNALSVRQPWASLIASGDKTIETRTWSTAYRGELLIVATRRPVFVRLLVGKAVCICELIDCRRMTKGDETAARCELFEGAFAWVLDNIRLIEPFEIKGQLGIYEVEIEGI